MGYLFAVLRFWVGCFLYLGFVAQVFAFVPKANPFPGGVAVIPLPELSSAPPKVQFQEQPVLVMLNPGKKYQWLAVVGLPVTLAPGKAFIAWQGQGNRREGYSRIAFTVLPKDYPVRHLKITDPRKVSPLPEDLERIEREGKMLEDLLKEFHEVPISSLALKKPVEGPRSSAFGLQRNMNGILKSRHNGLDLASPMGTPIYAAAAGKVMLVDSLFYSGNMVLLDHGQGFKTLYAHMDTTLVEKGDWVTPSTQLGTVGKTGRVTGPHLHFGVSLNNTRIDPEIFLR